MTLKVRQFLSLFIIIASILSFVAVPTVTFAQGGGGFSPSCSDVANLGDFIDLAGCLFNKLIPVLMTAAIVVFIYGIVVYIKNADNPEKRKEGNMTMLYGLLALFVMVSIWALVAILGETVGTGGIFLPQLPGTS
jgi:hypothetical protein